MAKHNRTNVRRDTGNFDEYLNRTNGLTTICVTSLKVLERLVSNTMKHTTDLLKIMVSRVST